MNKILWLVPVFGLSFGCDEGLPDNPEVTTRIPTSPGSDCATCHPRQFREWAGSSHNYGGGLDPTYQALEITANYLASAQGAGPIFRQAVLCVQCHAPTAGVIQDGVLNPNASFRAPVGDQTRELRKPENDEILLEPPGRASEEQVGEGDEVIARRRITFQGITCDSCHKVGQAFNDLKHEEAGQVCNEDTPECAARLRAQCEEQDDIRCRRIARGGHHDHEDFFEAGIANVAIAYEQEGTTRYGPFLAGDAAENIAHEVSAGATPEAESFVVSYPGQPMDARPYLQTSQFCGACHDVRLPIDNPATPEVELEPIHDEPFLRLENLYTEWLTSPLNLHPDADPRDNPYLDEDNNPRRIVCQDCHMSLFPYAPPGTFPGAYTAGEMDCDPNGVCGSQIALSELEDGTPTTLSNLRVPHRPRVTTHNMTGVDIRMGNLAPKPSLLGYGSDDELPPSFTLPSQVEEDAPAQDPDYGLPVSLDQRREHQLKHAVNLSLGGTPDTIDFADRDCSDGLCCDDDGHCNIPIKAWLTNVNGGHNVAAGFSQERQIWAELTVQDMGRDGAPVVDCAFADIDDLYTGVTMDGRYPRFDMHPKAHTASSANDLMDRLFGNGDHYMICRGMSGHLYDKPHDETGESAADGSLHDEDILLHRIGNTLPETEDGQYLLSWHILDLGLNPNDLAASPDAARITRPDQFHIPGNDPFNCELSRKGYNANLGDGMVTTFDPETGAKTTVPRSSLGKLTYGVTATPDERLEILYPFPEFKPLLPYLDEQSHLHAGDRFGLVYATNIFYNICGCPLEGDETCEGPHEVSPEFSDTPAQVPWLLTYPTLPALGEHDSPDNEDRIHFPVDRHLYDGFMASIGMPNGTPALESFTFIPLNSNHMPNNRSLKFYKPQRHYWDIRVNQGEVVGPLRVSVKAWYRHFPPEFLRLMARVADQAYQHAEAKGQAEELFPHGPLMVEGPEATAAYPNTGNIDNVKRFILDQSVFYIDVGGNNAGHEEIAVPQTPTWERNVQPIIQDHCLPCHSDVLRHGKLVLGYDEHPQWDDPATGDRIHQAQDPMANLVGAPSNLAPGETLVIPGNAEASWLYKVLTEENPHERVRRMPLKTDRLSDRELTTIRQWINTNAQR